MTPVYVCYFEPRDGRPVRELVDFAGLVRELAEEWGPVEIQIRGRFVRIELRIPAILTEKQRTQIKRDASDLLNNLLPSREFRPASPLRRQPARSNW